MQGNDTRNIHNGSRVLVFDYTLFINDRITPLSVTMKEATVVCRYGYRSKYNSNWIYPDLIDVLFNYNKKISKGHFTRRARLLD